MPWTGGELEMNTAGGTTVCNSGLGPVHRVQTLADREMIPNTMIHLDRAYHWGVSNPQCWRKNFNTVVTDT